MGKEKGLVKISIEFEIPQDILNDRYAEYLIDAETEDFEPISYIEHCKELMEDATLNELINLGDYNIINRECFYIKKF